MARLLLLLLVMRATEEITLMEFRNTCPFQPIRSKEKSITNQWKARLLQSQWWATGELSINRMEAIIWVNPGSGPGEWCNTVYFTQNWKLECTRNFRNLNQLRLVDLSIWPFYPAIGNNVKDDLIYRGQKQDSRQIKLGRGERDVLIHEFD